MPKRFVHWKSHLIKRDPETPRRAFGMGVRDERVEFALDGEEVADSHFPRKDAVRRVRKGRYDRQLYRGPHFIEPLRGLDRKIGFEGDADLFTAEIKVSVLHRVHEDLTLPLILWGCRYPA